jgi:hypothetical protein
MNWVQLIKEVLTVVLPILEEWANTQEEQLKKLPDLSND